MSTSDPHQLLAALASAENLRAPAQGAGKRQFRRFVIRGEAELHPMDGNRLNQQPISVLLRDVGRAGVGFVCEQKLEQASTWRCNFVSHGHVIGQQTLIVRHSREISPGVFLIGTQFCVDTGLLYLLGVDPAQIRHGDQNPFGDDETAFVPPSEVA